MACMRVCLLFPFAHCVHIHSLHPKLHFPHLMSLHRLALYITGPGTSAYIYPFPSFSVMFLHSFMALDTTACLSLPSGSIQVIAEDLASLVA